MANFAWPPSLPNCPIAGYSETSGVLITRTQTDSGPAKMRRRGRRPDTLSVQYFITCVQLETLKDFVNNTIYGVMRFEIQHPRTGAVVEVRIVPKDGGELFTIEYVAPSLRIVSMTLEVLP